MKIGVIGAGQMGGALIEGLLNIEELSADQIFVKGGSSGTAEKLQKKLGFQLVQHYEELKNCRFIFVATGAVIVLDIFEELGEAISEESIIISVAAGHTVEEAQRALGKSYKVVHAIPNTPVSVNAGVIGAACSSNLVNQEKAAALSLLEQLGAVYEVPETLMETFGTVAGCSPAFVFQLMEALADGAVLEGMPRGLAYEVIAQMVLGSAKLAVETKEHPGRLKDTVTSPGGSTIRGIAALEKNSFRSALIEAVKASNNS